VQCRKFECRLYMYAHFASFVFDERLFRSRKTSNIYHDKTWVSHFLMRFQIGKRYLVSVDFERIFVSPYNVPIHFFIERSSCVPVNVEHVENVHQVSSICLKTITELYEYLYRCIRYCSLYVNIGKLYRTMLVLSWTRKNMLEKAIFFFFFDGTT